MSLPPNFIAIALVAIGLLAAARLLWKRPQRWPWRLLLQSGALLLVYMVLNPPPQSLPQAGTLTVLGAGWRDALTHRVGPGPPEFHARLGSNTGEAADGDQRDRDQAAATTRSPAGSGDVGATGTADGRSGAEATVGQGPPYAVSSVAANAFGDGAVVDAATAISTLGPPAAIIALPEAEAPLPPGVQRTPDLATAMRLRPEFPALRLFGRGLSLRDLDTARGRHVELVATPLPRGFVEVAHAQQVNIGAHVDVGLRWSGIMPARVQLLDGAGEVLAEQVFDAEPAQAAASAAAPGSGARDAASTTAQVAAASVVDTAGSQGEAAATSQHALDAALAMRAGIVHLRTPARAAGTLPLRLRALGADEQTLDVYDFRVEVAAPRALKALMLAAAPGPETRALRRWAVDAGLDFDSRIQFAPGLVLGGRSLAPSAEELGALDLLIVEERAWAAFGPAGRAAVLAAVDDGLGLLLRLTALPNAGLLAELREAGFAIERSAGETSAQARLPVAPTRLRRLPVRVESAQAVPALVDASGETLALWRARGSGRLGLLWLTDSYRLQAAGHGEAYAALWSALGSALARAPEPAPPPLRLALPQGQQHVWAEEGFSVCGLGDSGLRIAAAADAALGTEGGETLSLATADDSGCSAVPPRAPGRYQAVAGDGRRLDITVRDPTAHAALRAADLQARSRALLDPRPRIGDGAARSVPGPFLSWLLALLGVLALLWWLERSPTPR